MKQRLGSYSRARIEGRGRTVVSQAGSVLRVETVRKSVLDTAISAALALWRKPPTVHDPGKILLDAALVAALGGGCLADVSMLRAAPAVFGSVASDPTVSRLIDTLASDGKRMLVAIRVARTEVRSGGWTLAGAEAPDAGRQVIGGPGRCAHAGALREAGRCRDLEEGLRSPSLDGLRRPRPRQQRRTCGRSTVARQRGLRHRRRPFRGHPTRPGSTAEEGADAGAGG